MKLPFTMGHEVVGEVLSVGPEAEGVAVGDRRIVYPWIGCGQCPECRRGEELMCLQPRIVGTWRPGGYSDRVIVPDARYLVPFDGVAEEVAATYACSGVTAYSAIRKAAIARPDQALLLIGAGGVGLQALSIARAVVPCPVGVADTSAEKEKRPRPRAPPGASTTVLPARSRRSASAAGAGRCGDRLRRPARDRPLRHRLPEEGRDARRGRPLWRPAEPAAPLPAAAGADAARLLCGHAGGPEGGGRAGAERPPAAAARDGAPAGRGRRRPSGPRRRPRHRPLRAQALAALSRARSSTTISSAIRSS